MTGALTDESPLDEPSPVLVKPFGLGEYLTGRSSALSVETTGLGELGE
jgi:hypothetical protein